jgi:hypothetical protein
MPKMSNGLAKQVFDNGPLGTFSAKIDVARALALIDDATRSDLRFIKAPRNLFAHAERRGRFHQHLLTRCSPRNGAYLIIAGQSNNRHWWLRA